MKFPRREFSMSCAAASMAMSRWSQCERGTPLTEISNRAASARLPQLGDRTW
jgi:hypothetical protein